ncbi:tyrosine-type recombinase/integrase [Streptomyces coffeae]|uniref:tyrosine-type recombinase/integrase n=1 Tax=Streptomyces coffeae TaxID=621382 RepID=UPI001F2F92F7|nr:tyrosine-type recombinase/integrase [Streptomyces coffeae]
MLEKQLARAPRATLATLRRDPRDQWPEHTRKLYDFLLGIYGEDDPLPTLAASWIAHQRSANTQKSYARGFRTFEEYAREHGTHPFEVRFMLADTFRMHLETAPTWVRVKGGARGEMAPTGKPRSDASRANVLSIASSFYDYLDKISDDTRRENPFAAVLRPMVDRDYSATEGLTEEQTALLLATARDRHQPAAYRPRAYALLLMLYTVCLRIDSALTARVEDLGYDRGHHVINARIKGGARKKKPVPPVAWNALMTHLDGRTEGLIFQTATGQPLDEPQVWRLVRSLAKRAGLPQADSIHPPRDEARRHHPRPGQARRPDRESPGLGRSQGRTHHTAIQPPPRPPRRLPRLRTHRLTAFGKRYGGYRRIHGQLAVLGIKVAASTVWEMLREHGIPPAPERQSATWPGFLRGQAEALLACGFRSRHSDGGAPVRLRRDRARHQAHPDPGCHRTPYWGLDRAAETQSPHGPQ